MLVKNETLRPEDSRHNTHILGFLGWEENYELKISQLKKIKSSFCDAKWKGTEKSQVCKANLV